MKIIDQQEINIKDITNALEQGKIIVYPTETCYGIGCRADQKEAVERLFAIKNRDENKPVLVLVSDTEAAKKYLQWNEKTEKLVNTFWPGPMTIVSKLKEQVVLPEQVTSENTLAVRVSPDNFVQKITKKVDFPIVSTSANISGQPAPYSVSEIKTAYEEKELQPDIIIDGGKLEPTPPSTIVSTTGQPEIIRAGSIPEQDIFNSLD